MGASTTRAALAIAGVLALLLIAYVFVGGSRGHADTAPHCTSQQALSQVKGELFRRAAAIRGTTDPAFQALENYSVVRAGSRLVRRHHPGSTKVSCSGALVLELPPGASVVGGRHSLSANLAYDLEPQQGGGARLLGLGNAENIAAPLASVSSTGGQPALTEAVPQANQPQNQLAAPVPPSPPRQPPAPARVQTARPASLPPPAPPPPSPPKKAAPPAEPKKAAPMSEHPKPAPQRPRPAAPKPAPVAVATATPSFNCRNARTRGEIAVCQDAGLASLDRQMSAEYYGAVRAARPGQRAMLERSRNRFLRYRDSCGSEACIADAYRERIGEISDIMSGGW